MGRPRQIAVSLLVIALGGAAAWWMLARVRVSTAPAPPELTFAEAVDQARASNAAALSGEAAAVAESTATVAFSRRYADANLGFSFGYPQTLTAGSFADPSSGATTVTVQDAAAHVGFQIYVTPWAGPAVTEQEVERDLPQVGPHGFETVSLAGVPGVAFLASDPNFGDSLQVWLVKGGTLYQISTYASQGALLSKVLGTWRWSA